MLTFQEFSHANALRCEQDFGRPVNEKTIPALVLEVGEECGEVIGAIRTFLGITTRKKITREEIGEEIADAFSYLDLLASSLGLSMEACLVAKFNKVSQRQGSKVFLGTQT